MNASLSVVKPHIGKLFRANTKLSSIFAHTTSVVKTVPKDAVLLLYSVEDLGVVTYELPNQIVCHFIYQDCRFVEVFKHSGDLFDKMCLINND